MADHDKLIDVIASLGRNSLSFIKEKVLYTENRSVYKKCRDIGLEWELHAPTHRHMVASVYGRECFLF